MIKQINEAFLKVASLAHLYFFFDLYHCTSILFYHYCIPVFLFVNDSVRLNDKCMFASLNLHKKKTLKIISVANS